VTISLASLGPDAQRQAVEQINAAGSLPKRHKYGAQRTELDGIWFPSKAEAAEYARLNLRLLANEIYGLTLQPEFPLVVAGHKIAVYRADFSYFSRATGKRHVVDVKAGPTKTPVYRIKKKLVRALYDIEVEEVA
jgi:Protein of unknown function (DUF1064)